MASDDYLPESEIDPITGKLRQVQLQAGSIVQTGINRRLLYTKAEVDAKIASSGGGGGGSGDMTKAVYDPDGVNGQLVGKTATQVLKNKSLEDATTFIVDDLDNTKQAWFQASGIDAGTLRTIILQNSSGTMYISGGQDVAIADGGTGASSLPTGLMIGAGTGAITATAAPSGTVVGTTDSQALTNKDLTSGTNTFPTFNQNTTGSAAKWTIARNLAGNSTDGSANVPFANKFIVQGTTDTGLSAAQFLGALGTGIIKNTTSTGVLSIAVAGDFPTLNQNTSGTAANLSGTPALPNGTTATTQAAADASTKLATTAYADSAVTTQQSAVRTLTNARITKRVLALSAGSATPAINTDSYDVVHITAQSAAITSFTSNLTGTPADGDTLRISITDNGTARALTWGTSFEASTVALPTTTVISTRLDVGFFWNTETSKWRVVAVA